MSLIFIRSQLPILDLNRVPDSCQTETGPTLDDGLQKDHAALKLEQSLDEYCHESLSADDLSKRNDDQVLRRYYNSSRKRGEDSRGHDKDIVVVSLLWVWRLGG